MRFGSLLAVIAAMTFGACFVDIEDVSDPGPAFAKARAEAARVEGRPGPPDSLEILVYDRGEGQLVRASLPMWVVEKMDDEGIDIDLEDDAAERVRSHLKVSDLEEAPLGPLVEVDEEDGDQVLVWLR
ncbi:MAG: hypothetical protein PVJ73_02340 [Acidobacteriota bacterium]|jgi:hypothetical protein